MEDKMEVKLTNDQISAIICLIDIFNDEKEQDYYWDESRKVVVGMIDRKEYSLEEHLNKFLVENQRNYFV